MYVIDGRGKAIGRIASEASEESLKGKKVRVINSEEAIIVGGEKNIVNKYKEQFNLRDLGNPEKSPKVVSRRPDLFLKKIIKRMLPKEKERGRKAERRIKAYMGDPEELKKNAEDSGKVKTDKDHITVEDLCEKLGWSR